MVLANSFLAAIAPGVVPPGGPPDDVEGGGVGGVFGTQAPLEESHIMDLSLHSGARTSVPLVHIFLSVA
jgi:hypothetical protein